MMIVDYVQNCLIFLILFKGYDLQLEATKSDHRPGSKCTRRFHQIHREMALHRIMNGGFIPNPTRRTFSKHANPVKNILQSIRSDDLHREYQDSKRIFTKTKQIAEVHSLPQFKKKSKSIYKNQMTYQDRPSRFFSTRLSSSTVTRRDIYGENMDTFHKILAYLRTTLEKIEKEDAAIIATYVCTQLAITLPVVLIPVIAADPYASTVLDSTVNSAAMVGKILSLGSIGLGVGKLLNGFICQAIGPRIGGSLYLLGVGNFALFLSTTSSSHAYAIAGMEFCASMMWTASLVLLSNRYAHDSKKFGTAMMALSLASTTGTMMSKFLGGFLLTQYHWREVTLFATVFAFLGSLLLFSLIKDEDRERNKRERLIASSLVGVNPSSQKPVKAGPSESVKAILQSISHVLLKGPIFWYVAFAHFTSFIVRSSDKILGSCLVDVAHVQPTISGALTTSVTLGFVIGLLTGQKVLNMKSIKEKQSFIFKRYLGATASACALAFCATDTAISIFGHTMIVLLITLASGCMSCCAGFQFYQIPAIHSTSYGVHKPVFISLCDAFGCLALSPFWSSISDIVSSHNHGWVISWLTVSAFIALGGMVMSKKLPEIMDFDQTEI